MGLGKKNYRFSVETKCNYMSFIGVATFKDVPFSEHWFSENHGSIFYVYHCQSNLNIKAKTHFITHCVQLLVSFFPSIVFVINLF